MTQEEKSLLLKDLCARLPYGVKVLEDIDKEFDGGCVSELATITEIKGEKIFLTKNSLTPVTIEEIRPYLRSTSSMTEEESKEFESIWNNGFGKALDAQISNFGDNVVRNLEIIASSKAIDWLNKKMFAYLTIDDKDMFELGLALKAPEGMYDIK